MKRSNYLFFLSPAKDRSRYVLAILIIVAAGLFGSVPYSEDNSSAPANHYNMKCVLTDAYSDEISSSNGLIRLRDKFVLEENHYYRLSFRLSSFEGGKTDQGIRLVRAIFSDDSLREIALQTRLLDEMGNALVLGQIRIELNSLEPSYFEYLIASDYRYKEAVIEPLSEFPGGIRIVLSDLRVTPVSAKNAQEMEGIRPTIVGRAERSSLLALQQSKAEQLALVDNNLTGVSFKAKSGAMNGVTVPIGVNGNGGLGYYRLVLSKLRHKDRNYQLEDSPLSFITFQASDLLWLKNNIPPSASSSQVGYYYFPLAGWLEDGEAYYLWLDSSQVKTAPRHSLALLKAESDVPDVFGLVGKPKDLREVQPFALDIGYIPEKTNNNELLAGSWVEDLGGHKGEFHYYFTRSVADLFNVGKFISMTRQATLLFDNQGGYILGRAREGDAYIGLSINTIYPFDLLHLRIWQRCMNSRPVSLEYSFDRENWQIVRAAVGSGDTLPRFDEVIAGRGSASVLFIRIRPESLSAPGNSDGYFTISGLEIDGLLRIEE